MPRIRVEGGKHGSGWSPEGNEHMKLGQPPSRRRDQSW
jgi:hypothetical protein